MRDGRDASPGVDPGGKAFPVAELLAHTGWMRALARGLVGDEGLAEDLVQESLLRAVERPPRRPAALGSWLRTVLRRAASRAREEGRSRERRERASARPERSESTPADVLERVEIQGEVVKLVLALEEPYRSAVLLRYFEEWSAEDIARRQGVDPATVRWRLRKALERLRERLDRLHGSHAAWCSALLSLLWTGGGAEAAPAAASAAARTGSSILVAARAVLPGVAIMKTKTVAVAALISFLLLLGLFVHLARDRAARPEAAPPPVASAARPAAAPARPAEKTENVPAAEPVRVPAPGRGSIVLGLVHDAESGESIPGATVSVRASGARAVAGDDGGFRLDGLAGGSHYLVAAAKGHAEEHARVRLEPGTEFVQDFRLESAVELDVTVLDAERQPLEGVEVTAAQPAGDYVREGYSRFTDPEGKAVLSGIGRRRQQQINARKEGYREVWTRDYRIEPDRDRSELTIVMERRPEGDAVVIGRVSGPDGAPLPGVSVQWIHSHGEHRGRVVEETARDGTYRLEFPRPGDWVAVSAYGHGYAPAIREGVRPGNSAEPARVDFTLNPGHRLEGRVLDEEDRPVAGARVIALPTIYHLRNLSIHPGIISRGDTDEQGRFSLENLAAPTTALRIHGPPHGDWGNNYHPQVEVDRQVTLRLLRFGLIRGRVVDRESGEPVQIFGIKLKKGTGYYDYPRSEPGEFFNSPEGLFALKKLDQDRVEFLVEADGYIPRWVRDLSAEPAERAPVHEVRITRGRTIEGRVVDATTIAPLAGAKVVFGAWEENDLAWDEGSLRKIVDRQEVVTGADGVFRVREGEPGTLFVRCEGYARLALPPAEWRKIAEPPALLELALERGTALSGVLFEDGVPSRRGFLVLYRQRAGGGEAGREWVGNLDRDDQGRFRVEELAPGEYFLEHWRETPGKKTSGLSIQRSLRLESGKENVLEFGADLGTVAWQGRLLAPDGKPLHRARLVLRPDFEWAYREFATTVDAEHDGRFHFLGLRPGRYRPEVHHGGKTVPLPAMEIESDLERDLVGN